MRKLDEIAHDHNATISRFRGLHIASIAVKFNGRANIVFSRKEHSLIGRTFPFLARREIVTGVYARGENIDKWADLFAGDGELCAALHTLLKGYSYSIEWASSRLSARVSALDGSIDGDATGGERFFANLDLVAARLAVLGERGGSIGQ